MCTLSSGVHTHHNTALLVHLWYKDAGDGLLYGFTSGSEPEDGLWRGHPPLSGHGEMHPGLRFQQYPHLTQRCLLWRLYVLHRRFVYLREWLMRVLEG